MAKRNKASEEHLTKAYRQIGIKAVDAAVKLSGQKEQSHHARTDVGQAEQKEAPMNEQSRRFAEKTTTAARENLERGASITEDATRTAEQSYSSALAGMRELNLKIIEMAHANTEAIFEFAHEIANAQAPSDLATIWANHARRQFELMSSQTKELSEFGQKLAGRTTEPFARGVNEVFARGT